MHDETRHSFEFVNFLSDEIFFYIQCYLVLENDILVFWSDKKIIK